MQDCDETMEKLQKIRMNRREVYRLKELFDQLHETDDFGFATLEQTDDGNGIGTNLYVTFYVTHGNMEGEFKVTITDERDW